MKIAFCNRPNWNKPLGGDGIQMLKTKEKLEIVYNLEINILTNPNEIDSSYDIVHIFNYATVDITKEFFEKAKSLHLKIVSSSIFWDYSFAIPPILTRLGLYPDFIGQKYLSRNILINKVISTLTNTPFSYPLDLGIIWIFLNNSDLVLPNSSEEGELILKEISTKSKLNIEAYKKKIKVVYNGVDISNVNIMEEKSFFNKYDIPKNYVLQVSRVQYLKNQLNLISALSLDDDIPLVFIGKIVEKNYFDYLKKKFKSRKNIYFLPEVDHSDIYSFFFYAKVHALLSLRESPGLVSLEALSQGCPIVVADKRFAPVDTYFKDNVEIVNPLDKTSIRAGIIKSINKERAKIDITLFSWENVAKQTYEAYLSLF